MGIRIHSNKPFRVIIPHIFPSCWVVHFFSMDHFVSLYQVFNQAYTPTMSINAKMWWKESTFTRHIENLLTRYTKIHVGERIAFIIRVPYCFLMVADYPALYWPQLTMDMIPKNRHRENRQCQSTRTLHRPNCCPTQILPIEMRMPMFFNISKIHAVMIFILFVQSFPGHHTSPIDTHYMRI